MSRLRKMRMGMRMTWLDAAEAARDERESAKPEIVLNLGIDDRDDDWDDDWDNDQYDDRDDDWYDCDDIPGGDADVLMSVAGRDCPHGCQHKSGLCQPFLALWLVL